MRMSDLAAMKTQVKSVMDEARKLVATTAALTATLELTDADYKTAQTKADSEKTKIKSLTDAAIHYSNYAEYNKQLRLWLVGFGIGGPVLFFTHPEVLKGIALEERRFVVFLFLIGSAIQVALAIINKTASWLEFHHEDCKARETAHKESWWGGKVGKKLSSWFLIDFLADGVSAVLFGWAIYLIAHSALKTSLWGG
jgi:hypothetical protein